MVERPGSERAVLGSLLIDPRCAGIVFEGLLPEAFSDSAYRNVFSAARRLYLEGKAIDAVIVCDAVGRAYEGLIAECMVQTPTANNVEAYVEILQNESRLRRLNELGMALVDVRDYQEGLKLLAKAESLLTANPTRRASSYTEMIGRYLDRQQDERPPDYIDFGFASLNRLNVSPGKFIILGADSSAGKTAFALQLAVNMAKAGKRVGFFSYETAEADVIDRILANTADVALPRSKSKNLSNVDMQRVLAEGMNADRVPLTLIEAAEYTVEDLRAETLAGRFEVIFIDYIQLIPGSGSKADRWQTVTEASMALHSMAQRLGVTIIALSQVTLPDKNKNGQRPQLRKENLRESRQLIMDADAILMMDLENPVIKTSPRVIIVDKNKDGPLAEIRMSFDPIHMRFTPLEAKPMKNEKRTSIPGQRAFTDLPDDDDENPFERR